MALCRLASNTVASRLAATSCSLRRLRCPIDRANAVSTTPEVASAISSPASSRRVTEEVSQWRRPRAGACAGVAGEALAGRTSP